MAGAALLALWLAAGEGVDLAALGGFGLAGVLPAWAWVALVCAVAACVTEIRRERPRPPVLLALTGVLVLTSTGMPSVLEPEARLPITWLHSGFVEAIAGEGTIPTGVDSRFSWAGFFAQWAWIVDAAGGMDLAGVLRWAPPVIVATWAVGTYAIARPLLGAGRGPWVAVWVLCGANWIEQDYFSPQATAVVLLLAVLASVLGPLAARRGEPLGRDEWLAPRPGSPRPSRMERVRRALRTPVRRPNIAASQVLLLWTVVAVCQLALVVDHQLTPFALGIQLFLLAVAGRFWGRGLLVILVLAELTWFVLGAREFWMYQLALATSDVGEVGGSLASALLERLGGDPGQRVIKLGRVLVGIGICALALVGAWIRWKDRGELILPLLAFAPVVLVLLQSYGGEVLMRLLLYGLPILAVLCVDALRSAMRRRPRTTTWLLSAGMLMLFASLVVLRGGNDAYSAIRPESVAVTRQVLAAVPPGTTVVGLHNEGPLQLDRARDVVQVANGDTCDAVADDLIPCVSGDERPDVILVLPEMEALGVVYEQRPPGWSRAAIGQILATGGYRIVTDTGVTTVLERVDP